MVGEIGQVVWSVQSVNYIHDFLMGVVVKYSLFPVLLLLGFTARRYGLVCVCVCVRASMPACDSGCHTLHQHLHHIHDPKSATILCTSWCAVHACAGHAHAHTHTHTHRGQLSVTSAAHRAGLTTTRSLRMQWWWGMTAQRGDECGLRGSTHATLGQPSEMCYLLGRMQGGPIGVGFPVPRAS